MSDDEAGAQPEPVTFKEETTAVRPTVLTADPRDSDAAALVLDSGRHSFLGPSDIIDELPEPPASGGLPPSARARAAMDVQRALDIGVTIPHALIEPLPEGSAPTLDTGEGAPRIPITRAVTVIGRRLDSADVVLDSDDVSRRHAALVFVCGSFFIEDLRSSNGTFVAGRRVRRARVNPGDSIRIGRWTVRLFLTPP